MNKKKGRKRAAKQTNKQKKRYKNRLLKLKSHIILKCFQKTKETNLNKVISIQKYFFFIL